MRRMATWRGISYEHGHSIRIFIVSKVPEGTGAAPLRHDFGGHPTNGESCSLLSQVEPFFPCLCRSLITAFPVRYEAVREATRASPPRIDKGGVAGPLFRCRVHVVSLSPRVTIVIIAGPLPVQKGCPRRLSTPLRRHNHAQWL